MFIKVISCHFYLVSNSMDPDQDRHFSKLFIEVFSGHPYLASNGMDPDQDRYFDEPGLGPNC